MPWLEKEDLETMPMQYPPRPWTDGQTYVYNGTSYVYEAATNSWRFSSLTYARPCQAMQFNVPQVKSSFYMEVSESPLFESILKKYDSTVRSQMARMLLFSKEYGQFVSMASPTVSSSSYQTLVVIPKLDMSKRYYCRFRWTTESGAVGPWKSIVVPTGYVEGETSGGGGGAYDDTEVWKHVHDLESGTELLSSAVVELSEDLESVSSAIDEIETYDDTVIVHQLGSLSGDVAAISSSLDVISASGYDDTEVWRHVNEIEGNVETLFKDVDAVSAYVSGISAYDDSELRQDISGICAYLDGIESPLQTLEEDIG